ncbi:uncharacterized protein HMPREF1541_01166 [Cyphellophora europaea CBS 101466]|uniref:F-box domain-containing protein n=1 Tax=Cyphellophora europaea (strain CBS 101466) TaxID=1220924 RepID=W2SE28_CYPE1|nr:uncharacterized protein HMPREF1541_01166 [Cyphellophora europaea CBS 101466]ETN46976.1 hypothetical protein HMPREF1541_01166 [Cyphellophora europaea CBS 101466]
MDTRLPPDLLDVLSNSIVSNNIITYLPLASRFALIRTCHSYRNHLLSRSDAFRCLDLSKCKGAYIPYMRVDSGGQSFRAERMDESLTEDEFHAGPLRGVLRNLHRQKIMPAVNSLVLDGLASITNDLLHEMVTSMEYNVRLLSIRRCPNVNQAKLQQLLAYICRPGRPEGTPRLQGLYMFTNPSQTRPHTDRTGIIGADGAQLGALPTTKGVWDGTEPYYAPAGRLVHLTKPDATFWAQTIGLCKGIVWFDAILCTHMHSGMAPMISDNIRDERPEMPPIATIALGPAGCTGCGRAPQGAPVWGQSDFEEFPLLWPPPASGRIVDAIRPPPQRSSDNTATQRLIVSCQWCIDNRHCDSCHKWWCSDCYNPKEGKNIQTVEELHDQGAISQQRSFESNTSIKVLQGFCVQECLRGELMAGAGAGGMWG